MSLNFKLVANTLLGILFLAAPVLAIDEATCEDNQVVEQQGSDQAVVNRRTDEDCLPIQKDDDVTVLDEETKELFLSKFGEMNRSVTFTNYTGVFHYPTFIGLYGQSVQFEDGTFWVISPNDAYKVIGWYATDPVVIVPNHSWLTSNYYHYKLVNQMTGATVEAMVQVPEGFILTSFNHKIIAYDDYLQMIWLDDGSVWSISGWDYSKKWHIGDMIIVGMNDGFLSSTHPHILINANLINKKGYADSLEYARASCVR